MHFFFLLCVSFSAMLFGKPPQEIPPHLRRQYTMENRIPVRPYYIDGTYSSKKPRFFAKSEINSLIERVYRREQNYYRDTDTWLYQALEAFPIAGKEVAIIGSVEPWYESVVIAYRGKPTTIEYNRLITDDDRLCIMTVTEYEKNPKRFDVILSISSIEHDGLGRYGDPLDPDGDLKTMGRIRSSMLKKGGFMLLAVPVGRDCLCWNAHRVYGPLRLNKLLKGWKILGKFGFDSNLFNRSLGEATCQPVFCLSPE